MFPSSFISATLKKFRREYKALNRIEISRSRLLHNYDTFQEEFPDKYLIPVLKGNAYGHGLESVAKILKARTFPYIAVDGYFEALRIRQVSKQPLLVMGSIAQANIAYLHLHHIAYVVHDLETIKAFAQRKQPVTLHLEIDTGMTRHGIQPEDIEEFLSIFSLNPLLKLEGVMSHLADASNPTSTEFNERQTKRFDETLQKISAAGFNPSYIHLGQTAGSQKVHSLYANSIRLGIGLYGINPLSSTDPLFSRLSFLQPALEVKSTITKVTKVPAGTSISYGQTYTTKKPTYVGVIPFGYYEGIPRLLSNHSFITHNHQVVPILGRVCMNHSMLGLPSSAKVGDEVTIISNQPDQLNSAASLWRQFDFYPYEILVKLSSDIRRVIIP